MLYSEINCTKATAVYPGVQSGKGPFKWGVTNLVCISTGSHCQVCWGETVGCKDRRETPREAITLIQAIMMQPRVVRNHPYFQVRDYRVYWPYCKSCEKYNIINFRGERKERRGRETSSIGRFWSAANYLILFEGKKRHFWVPNTCLKNSLRTSPEFSTVTLRLTVWSRCYY